MTERNPTETVADAYLGANAGAAAAERLELLDDLLAVTEVVAKEGGFEPGAFRTAGLGRVPEAGFAAVILRGLPFGLLTPNDRPRLRRDAYRCAAGGGDEVAAVAAVAIAVLVADLVRGFDIEEARRRCHQTLLEEAPLALLEALLPIAEDTAIPKDDSPIGLVQAAVIALERAHGVDEVVAQISGNERSGSLVVAGALAGIRDGSGDVDRNPSERLLIASQALGQSCTSVTVRSGSSA